jgi:ABC-type uncharacterized transport system permease subunit
VPDASTFVLVASAIALALYGAAAFLHLRALRRDAAAPSHARWFTGVGLAVHGSAIAWMAAEGVRPGFAEFVSGVAFVLMVASAFTARGRLAAVGAFLTPVAVVLLGIAFLAPSAHVVALDQVEGSWFLPVHIGLMAAAMASLFVEFTTGVVQLVVRRRLKAKKLVGLGRLPALEVLDSVQFRALVLGLACLALGIGAGGLWASSTMHHRAWAANPKVWSTAVVWAWYAVLLQLRVSVGWHGRWSILLSSLGFVALVFSFLGLDFVVGGFHAYGG